MGAMTTRTLQSLAAASFIFLTTSAFADDATDVVVLSSGGRVRGSVLEQSPASGVRIKLYDGSVRSYSAFEVQRVQFADGATVSSAPNAPDSAAPVAQAFRARAGETAAADIEPTNVTKIARAKLGAHLDLGAMVGYRTQRSTVIPGGGVRAGVTYGIVPALELIGSLAIGYYAGNIDNADYATLFGARMPGCVSHDHNCTLGAATQTSVPMTASIDLELHLGTTYSMMIGVDAGLSVELQGATATALQTAPIVPNVDVIPVYGLHGSLLTFRFGPRRELGISLQQGALFGGDSVVFEQTLRFHYSFL